jgi:hypothetical protein
MALIQLAPPYPVFTDKNGDPLDNGYLYFGVVDLNPETNPIQVYYDSTFTQPVAQPIRTSNGYPMRNGAPALIFAGSQFSVTVRDKNSDLVIYSPVGYGVSIPARLLVLLWFRITLGDGVTTAFGMGASPSSENATNVFIDGVYQNKSTYSISGSTLTFSEAPPLYSAIEIVSNQTAIVGGTDAGLVTYNEGGLGAVTRTVQSRLRDFVSVKDFGAVGDGVTDDTAAIQAALDSGAKLILLPRGDYKITSTLTIPTSVILRGDGINNTQISNDSNTFAFTLTNCIGSGIEGIYIYSVGTDGAEKGILIEQSATGNSRHNFVRSCWFNGRQRAPVATVTQTGVYMTGAAIGYTNYWNIIEDCVFQSFNTPIAGEFNANAAFLNNLMFEDFWYAIRGAMQQWSATNMFMHSSVGAGADYCYAVYLTGSAIYNNFTFTQETGGTLDKVYYLGPSTIRNVMAGLWQASARGENSGSSNALYDYINNQILLDDAGIDVTYISADKLNDVDSNSAGTENIAIFGDGTFAQAGSGQQKIQVFGGSAESRKLEIYQAIGGAAVIDGSGGASVTGGGFGVTIGDGTWNSDPLKLGSNYLWVDSTGDLRIKASAPASDTDGTIVGTQS